MSFLGGVFSSVSKAMDFLSGAVDIIVVQQPDKTFKCTPFHVKFGTLKILSSAERTVRIMVNGKLTDIYMKTEESGVAFFEPIATNITGSISNPSELSGESSRDRSPFSKSPLSPSKEDFTFEDQQFSLDMDTLDNVKQTTPTETRKIANPLPPASSHVDPLTSITLPNRLSVERDAAMDLSTHSTHVDVPNGSKYLSQRQSTAELNSTTDIPVKPLMVNNQQEQASISVVQQSPSTIDPSVENSSNMKDIRIRVLVPPSSNKTPIGEGSKWFSWLSFFKKQNPADLKSANVIIDEEGPAVKVVPDAQFPNTLNIIVQPSNHSGISIALSDPLMQHALAHQSGRPASAIPTTSKASVAANGDGNVVNGGEDTRNALKNSISSLSLSGSTQDFQHLHSDFTEENEFIEEQFMEEMQRYHNNPIPKLESVKDLLSEKNIPEKAFDDIKHHNDKGVVENSHSENVTMNSASVIGDPLQVSTSGKPSQERQSVRSAGSGSDNEVTSASNKSESSYGSVTFNQVKSTHGTPHNGSPSTSPPPSIKELVTSNQQQQQPQQIIIPQAIKVSQKVDIRSSESLSKLTPSLPLSMSPPSGTTAVENIDALSSLSKDLGSKNIEMQQIEHEEIEEQASSANPKTSSWRLNWLWVDTKSPAGLHHKKSKETMQHKYYNGETSYMMVRSLRPTSDQLRSMMLRLGKNEIKFYVNSRFQGNQEIVANIWLWPYDAKIVISDVDGTITRSDVLGHFLPMFGKDWSHNGIASLYCSIAENGYRIVYLTSRSLLQAEQTRAYIRGVRQGVKSLPDGPIVTSPEKIFEVLTREVITKNPEEFKIAALRDIRSLFSKDVNPFYAGFGNKDNDLLSYKTVGVHPSRIFIIDTSSKIRVDSVVTHKSYSDVDDLVHMIFPRLKENDPDLVDKQFSSFLFWKIPVESVEEVSRRVLQTSTANKKAF